MSKAFKKYKKTERHDIPKATDVNMSKEESFTKNIGNKKYPAISTNEYIYAYL